MIPAARWEPAAGFTLEPNALLAVRETSASIALTAGPGAGKTELLAQRADFLFRTGACLYPKRILAISFKVDAARNLRKRVAQRCGGTYASRLDSVTFHAFAKRIIDRYRPLLTGLDALNPDYTIGSQRAQHQTITFQDLVPLALKIVNSSPVVRNAIRQTYSHVFLDEFQDCTNAQYDLVHALFTDTPALLTAVGDTKQRIMAWAGAMDGVFLRLQHDFDATPLNIYQNFRSNPVLRRMQNRMVAVMDPGAAMDESEIPGDEGRIDKLPFTDDEQEAAFLTAEIVQLIESGTPPTEIAVLVAKEVKLFAATLMRHLEERGVPVHSEQMQDLAAEPIVELALDGLRMLLPSPQPAAYHRMMATVEQLTIDTAAADTLKEQISRFVSTRRSTVKWDADNVAVYLGELVTLYLSLFGTDAITSLSVDYHDQRRVDQLVEQLLERLATLIDRGHEPLEAIALISGENAVHLLTIHKSKGLEFETVVMLGVEDETYWADPDDERCVFFVGISRAKTRLILTTADARARPPEAINRWDVIRNPHAEFLGYV
jgi:superfamily I DNA/RNA helicase